MNIHPSNPINNIADSDLLSSIAEAFAEIEKHDVRVEKVTLTQDRYNEMITKRGSLEYLCVNDTIRMTEEIKELTDRYGIKRCHVTMTSSSLTGEKAECSYQNMDQWVYPLVQGFYELLLEDLETIVVYRAMENVLGRNIRVFFDAS